MKIEVNKLRNIPGIGPKTMSRVKEELSSVSHRSEFNASKPIRPNSVVLGDCLDKMNGLPDNSVDMVLSDPPYGVTARNKWDTPIDLDHLWKHVRRVVKPDGAIVLTAAQPFTTTLIASNPDMFRYDLVWDKGRGTDFLNAHRKPLRSHEEVCVFYSEPPTYNPQFWYDEPYAKTWSGAPSSNYGEQTGACSESPDGKRFPLSILEFKRDGSRIHPTQKPVALFEWLIRTYTNDGEVVLDFAAGSGTTAVACQNTERRFVLIEKEREWFDVIKTRLNANQPEEV